LNLFFRDFLFIVKSRLLKMSILKFEEAFIHKDFLVLTDFNLFFIFTFCFRL
jgi:hypothetical protein